MLDTAPSLPSLDDQSAPIDEAYEYSRLVEDGIFARRAMDTGRWLIGGNVRKLVTFYRERTVEQYADDIGMDARRCYEYAGVASFYPLEIREQLEELDLSYSHYREARRLKDLNQAIAFLKLIASHRWTLADTRTALKNMQQNDGVYVAPSYSDSPPVTNIHGERIDQRPNYQWRGPATVSIDAKGIVRLQCVGIPEIESGVEYIVSFERRDGD